MTIGKKFAVLLMCITVLFGIEKELVYYNGIYIEVAKGEVVFKLKNGVDSKEFIKRFKKDQGKVAEISIKKFKLGNTNKRGLVKIKNGFQINEVIDLMYSYEEVIYAGVNVIIRKSIIPDDDYATSQYALNTIDLKSAWEFEKGDPSLIIGVLDSGIPLQNGSLSHSDLNNANRYILGKNRIVGADTLDVADDDGHGTHVLGIIGAMTDNDEGVFGTNWNSKIYIGKVFDENGEGTEEGFFDGVCDAIAEGAKIINFSGGSPVPHESLEDAVQFAADSGVLLVVAAGNTSGGDVDYPAAYSNQYDNLISVSATKSDEG